MRVESYLSWCRRIPQVPELHDGRLVVLGGEPELRGDVRMPLHRSEPDSGLCVAELNNRLILPQIPDDAPRTENRRQDVLHLAIPRNVLNVLQRLRLVAGRHRRRGVVQIPNENVRFGCARREQIRLERVVVEGAHGACMLVLRHEQSIFARQQLLRTVQQQVATFASPNDHSVRMVAVYAQRAPNDFLKSG